MRKAYQSDLSDAEWSCLEPHLPIPKATGRPNLEGLRVRVELDKDGNARISGMFDTDIVELLPMAQHLREAADKPYRRRFRHEIPPEHKGVISLDNTRIVGCSPSPTTS